MTDENWTVIISSYSRAQALADGVLVDVSETAKEAGYKWPVALTHKVWARYVTVPVGTPGQDEKGRLWDILHMLRVAIKGARTDDNEMTFRLHVAMPDKGDWESNEDVPQRGAGFTRQTHRLVTLKAHIGPGDTPEPVFTIMLPGED